MLLHEYYELAILHMTVINVYSWHAYRHGLFSLSYITLLVVNTIHLCSCLILYINGEHCSYANFHHYTLHPALFPVFCDTNCIALTATVSGSDTKSAVGPEEMWAQKQEKEQHRIFLKLHQGPVLPESVPPPCTWGFYTCTTLEVQSVVGHWSFSGGMIFKAFKVLFRMIPFKW